jgi:tetratricopeptide (TPR) repeat protein
MLTVHGRNCSLQPRRSIPRPRPALPRSRRSGAGLCLFALLALLLPAGPARANELDDFQQARQLYEAQQYDDAAFAFEDLIGGEVPRLRNRALLLESRKFLGVCYLFLGKREQAEKQFELLLGDDHTYQLDPVAFPEEVQEVFGAVRKRLESESLKEARQRERDEQQARKEEAEKLIEERKDLLRLVELAETERVEHENSRWIALIPFGVGQFQNGHKNLGIFLAVSEALLVALNITSYFLHQSLEGQQPEPDRLGEARFAEKTFRITNQVTLGVLGVLSIGGIIDAQIRFKPVWTRKQRRKIPDDLRDTLQLGSVDHPAGFGLRF